MRPASAPCHPLKTEEVAGGDVWPVKRQKAIKATFSENNVKIMIGNRNKYESVSFYLH